MYYILSEGLKQKMEELVKTHFNINDRFCNTIGIQIITKRKGYAESQCIVERRHLNGMDNCQGGVIYTMADFALAAASCTTEVMGVSLHCDITYYKPGQLGDRLVAEATEENRTRRTSTVQVRVYAYRKAEGAKTEEKLLIAAAQGILSLFSIKIPYNTKEKR